MPDDDAKRRADHALAITDLGDWSIIVDDVADDLDDVYAEGLAEGLKLTGMGVDLDRVNQRAVDWARQSAASLVTQIESNTRDMLRSTVATGIEEGWSAARLAEEIAKSPAFDDDRAMTIARSEISAANNQGALRGYRDAAATGIRVQKEWLDADADDECADNADDGPIDLDDVFSSGDDAPPAHPNAVFAGGSFAPYGCLTQVLRSRYDGSAVTINALLDKQYSEFTTGDASSLPDVSARNVLSEQAQSVGDLSVSDWGGGFVGITAQRISFTVGPNHPILTRRGFVIASELCEGDQLLCDIRVEFSAAGTESDFKQMPFIENAFAALSSRFGNAIVASAGAYFHGDQVFAHGEVEAVRPTRDLLPILNPSGLEHLCECDFMRTYPEAAHVASCSACFAAFDRVFVAASSEMGCVGGCAPLFSCGGLPPFFKVATISSCHVNSYSGWAFDASTLTGLYNYSGVVVKNCRCAITPYLPDDEDDEEE